MYKNEVQKLSTKKLEIGLYDEIKISTGIE